MMSANVIMSSPTPFNLLCCSCLYALRATGTALQAMRRRWTFHQVNCGSFQKDQDFVWSLILLDSMRNFKMKLILLVLIMLSPFFLAENVKAGLFDFMNSPPVRPAYRSLVNWIPAEQIRLDVAVWYPTRAESGKISTGGQEFYAARNARPIPGLYPLIILSHDSAGTRFSYHHLAERLVELGYIVAAPQHDGDNADDMSLLFSDAQLTQRSRQLRNTLDLVLGDPHIGPLIDMNSIALIGFGNGGSAGLLCTGAALTPDQWKDYCPELEKQGKSDPYCIPHIAERMRALTEVMRYRAQARKDATERRRSALLARENELSRLNSAMGKRHRRLSAQYKKKMQGIPLPPAFLPPLPPLPPRERIHDDRVKALVLVAPGYAMLFEQKSLANVHVPILLIGTPEDRLNKPDPQSLMLSSGLTKTRVESIILPGADSLSLMALCPPELAANLPDFCPNSDPQKHQRLENALVSTLVTFFDKAFPPGRPAYVTPQPDKVEENTATPDNTRS